MKSAEILNSSLFATPENYGFVADSPLLGVPPCYGLTAHQYIAFGLL